MGTIKQAGRPRARFALNTVVCALFSAGCSPPLYDAESAWVEGAPGRVFQGMTVDDVEGCSTAAVRGLSLQLVNAVNCARPTTLLPFEHPGISVGEAVWPYLQDPAQGALLGALEEQGGGMQVNSAFRTLAQQYLLYAWYQRGQCGISLAARPGRSNHESGLALDLQDHAAWRSTLEAYGWLWFGNSDPVHFDFAGGGTVNLAPLSVESFQRLWNRNHPEDLLVEDGIYGPNTESRLRQAPAEGFALDLCAPAPDAGTVMPADAGSDGGASVGAAGDVTYPLEVLLPACRCVGAAGGHLGWPTALALLAARRRQQRACSGRA